MKKYFIFMQNHSIITIKPCGFREKTILKQQKLSIFAHYTKKASKINKILTSNPYKTHF